MKDHRAKRHPMSYAPQIHMSHQDSSLLICMLQNADHIRENFRTISCALQGIGIQCLVKKRLELRFDRCICDWQRRKRLLYLALKDASRSLALEWRGAQDVLIQKQRK